MSTEIKNTLFRFVSMRAPELSNDSEPNLRFVFRDKDLTSVFEGVLGTANKMDAFKVEINNAIVNETFDPKTTEDIKDFIKTKITHLNKDSLFSFSVWLAKNKIGYRKTELETKIAAVKPIFDTITTSGLESIKIDLWDNIFYQVVLHKDFYAKELAMQLLHAFHVIENYEQGNHAKNALLMKARVVLPKEFFVDEVVEETNTTFSTLSTEPRVALLPNRIMQKQHIIAYAEDENEKLENLKADLQRAHKQYQKDYAEALKEAQETHYTTRVKPLLDAHKLAVQESLENWCSVRNPELEYNPKDPCTSPPVIPEPDLPPFSFTFTDEMDLEYLGNQGKMSEESLELLATLTSSDNLQARGLNSTGSNFGKTSVLKDADSFSKTFAGIENLVANNTNLILDNTETGTTKFTSIGGIFFPISNQTSIVNPFDYELSTISLITGEQRASFSFEVPDNSWEIESFTYTLEKASTTYFNLVSQSRRIGNHIMLNSLPLGNLKVNETVGAFNGEIIFTNGIKLNLAVGNFNLSDIFKGQLINENAVEVDKNDGFVPSGFGMKQIGIADYKRVEQSVHCYVEGEVAHIENIMAREYKEKSTRRLRKSENTTTSSSESERERLTDTTSTDRYDMQSEVAKVIQQSNDLSAGAQFSASGAGYSVGGFANFASHNSKEESTRQSVTQAKEITEKALDRIVNKVKEERIEKIVEEYEENNKHGFDNTQGDKHVVGVYRWVDKLYKNKVVNYGKRLMFEFMIPQPGKLHTLGMVETAQDQVTLEKPEDPRKVAGALNLKDYSKVGDETLKYWASKYNVEIPAMLEKNIYIGKTFNYQATEVEDNRYERASSSAELDIPEGYQTVAASVVYTNSGDAGPTGFSYAKGLVGGREIGTNETTISTFVGKIPVSYSQLGFLASSINFSVKCEPTPEAIKRWQQETFKAIIDAYQDALAIFKEKEEAEKQKATVIKGTNPGFYRQIENTILRKNCISYMIDRRQGAKKTYGLNMTTGDNFANYEVTLNQDLDNYAAFVKFMEQAFEWDLMSYNLYPYYWGGKKDWTALYQYDESNDPLFRNFMQSGMARVIATVRPGFEEAVRYFLQTGKIWNGGEVPLIEDELFMSIVEELEEQEGKQEGKAWITRLPTALTILQADSIGLIVEKALPCNCEDEINDETYENPEEALCSSEIAPQKGQVLAGEPAARAQNNITRVVRVNYGAGEDTIITKVVNAINTGQPNPVKFTILEDEDYIITASPQGMPSVPGYVMPVFKYKVVNIGKNKAGEHYGFEGVQLTADNLELIYSNEPAVNDYLDNPSTQLIDLGWDITGTTLPDFINTLEESIEFQEQEDGYVLIKAIDGDEPKTYFFTGQGGEYGLNWIQAQEKDFVLLSQNTVKTTEESFVYSGNKRFALSETAKSILLVTLNGQKLNKIEPNLQYFLTGANELEIVDHVNSGDTINVIYFI